VEGCLGVSAQGRSLVKISMRSFIHQSGGLSDILSSRGRVTLVLLAQSTAAHLLTPIYPRHFSKRFKVSRVFVSFVAHLSLVSKATTSIKQ
jgi:hypothetical protein